MKKRDNDFIDQRLNSLIGNIFLFNSKMEKFNTSRTMLKKSIKTDAETIGENYGFPLKVAMFTVDLFIDNENREISCIFGADLHSQLVIQGLAENISLFRNYSLDIPNSNVIDESGNIILYNNGYIPTEYVYIPAFNTSVNGVSISEVKTDTYKYTVYFVRKKFLYVDVEEISNV